MRGMPILSVWGSVLLSMYPIKSLDRVTGAAGTPGMVAGAVGIREAGCVPAVIGAVGVALGTAVGTTAAGAETSAGIAGGTLGAAGGVLPVGGSI